MRINIHIFVYFKKCVIWARPKQPIVINEPGQPGHIWQINLVWQVKFHLARTNFIWPRGIGLDKWFVPSFRWDRSSQSTRWARMSQMMPIFGHNRGRPGTSGATTFLRCASTVICDHNLGVERVTLYQCLQTLLRREGMLVEDGVMNTLPSISRSWWPQLR